MKSCSCLKIVSVKTKILSTAEGFSVGSGIVAGRFRVLLIHVREFFD